MLIIKSLVRISLILLVVVSLLTVTFAVPKAQARGADFGASDCYYDKSPALADTGLAEAETEGTVLSLPYVQQAYFKASNTNAADRFGTSVAIAGDTLVVGAKDESSKAKGVNGDQKDNSVPSAGAVYVFVRSNGGWIQQAYLKASAPDANDEFGSTVAISENTIVVGAPNEDSNAIGVNGNHYNNAAQDSGAVYVFTRTAGVWTQQAYIKASNTEAGDAFGASVSISVDALVVGAPGEDSNATGANGNQADNSEPDSGAAYVFTRNGISWIPNGYLKASNAEAGDRFGASTAIAGNTLTVGAPYEDSNATGVNGNQADNSVSASGAAYVFTRGINPWSQQAYIKASNTRSNSHFGAVVAISANSIVVGAPNYSSHSDDYYSSGAAYVFNRSSNVWSEQGLLRAADAEFQDNFGSSVGISGDKVIVGAPGECSGATGINGETPQNWDAAPQSGAAYAFVRNDNSWQQQAYMKASNTNEADEFGGAVAIYGNTLVSGAHGEASNAKGVNGDQLNNSMAGAGAAYIFTYIPTAISSLRVGASPTTASTVDFNVNFAEPMTGVDASDFAPFTTSGISGTSVVGVSGGPASYTVTVNTGVGDGTLRLDVKDDDSILNAKNIPLGGVGVGNGVFISGELYLVRPRTKVIRSQGAEDGWLLESSEMSNRGGTVNSTAGTFRLGDDAANKQYRAILDFDTSSLPATIVVTKATLKIMKQTLVGTDLCSKNQGVVANYRNPFFGLSSALEAGDFHAPDNDAGYGNYMVPPASGSWYSLNIYSPDFPLFSHPGSVQFRLFCYTDDNNDNDPDYLAFYSGDIATVSYRPALVLEYYVPNPSVLSSLRASASPTTANSVDFNVTFSEPMRGVDASDFALVTSSEVSGASVVGVSGGPSTYTVTVNSGSGAGTIRLDVKDDDSIRNAKNIPLGNVGVGNGDFSDGETYLMRPLMQIFQSQAAQDGWVLGAYQVEGPFNSTATTFRLGDDAANMEYRTILHFDTASLPETVVITNAALKIMKQAAVGTDPFTKNYLFLDIRKSFFGLSPALEARDAYAADSAGWGDDIPAPSGDWYSFFIDSYIYPFLNRTGSTQLRLHLMLGTDNNINSADYAAFYSGDAPTASYRPALVVQYYVP